DRSTITSDGVSSMHRRAAPSRSDAYPTSAPTCPATTSSFERKNRSLTRASTILPLIMTTVAESAEDAAMARDIKRIETKLIHAGEPDPLIGDAVVMPICQSATFEYTGASSYHDLRYIRLNNTPNHDALHAKLAALESAESALVSASGMAAISATLMAIV